jgi:hypothetical protein
MADGPIGNSIDDDLQLLDAKLRQLKQEYEAYFLGNRPREPAMLRGEVQKIVNLWSNLAISNTATRFRFNNLVARFFVLKTQWNATLRKIEDGTYERHLFKAGLRKRDTSDPGPTPAPRRKSKEEPDLYEAYLEARRACGEQVDNVTREKLDGLLQRQEEELRKRYGCREVRFRVVVEAGKARVKATPVK